MVSLSILLGDQLGFGLEIGLGLWFMCAIGMSPRCCYLCDLAMLQT